MHALSLLAVASFAAPVVAQGLAPFDASTLMAGNLERFVKTADLDSDVDLLTNRLLQNNRHNGEPRGLHVQLGTSTLGEGGVRPLLGAHGPFQVGESVRIVLRGARPGATGVLTTSFVAGLPADSLGGVIAQHPSRIHSQILFTTTGTALDPAGSGTWEFPYTVPSYVVGRTKLYVADIDDPTTRAGSARSNRLYVQYGP